MKKFIAFSMIVGITCSLAQWALESVGGSFFTAGDVFLKTELSITIAFTKPYGKFVPHF